MSEFFSPVVAAALGEVAVGVLSVSMVALAAFRLRSRVHGPCGGEGRRHLSRNNEAC